MQIYKFTKSDKEKEEKYDKYKNIIKDYVIIFKHNCFEKKIHLH